MQSIRSSACAEGTEMKVSTPCSVAENNPAKHHRYNLRLTPARGSVFRATYQDRAILTGNICFKTIRKLGAGSFAMVFLAEDESNQRKFALKVERKQSESLIVSGVWSDVSKSAYTKEAAIHAKVNHKNIIPFLGCKLLKKRQVTAIVMPVAEGTLYTKLSQQIKPLQQGMISIDSTLPERINIVKKIFDAVAYLHRKNITHNDIKSNNILYLNGQPVLSDFGFAEERRSESDQWEPENNKWNVSYMAMAPEYYYFKSGYKPSIDIYGIGRITLNCINLDLVDVFWHSSQEGLIKAWYENDSKKLYEKPDAGALINIFDVITPDEFIAEDPYVSASKRLDVINIFMRKVIVPCLAINYEERPTMSALSDIIHSQ